MILDGNYPPDARIRKQTNSLTSAGHDVNLLCITDQSGPQSVAGVGITRVEHPPTKLSAYGFRRAFENLGRNVFLPVVKEIRKEIDSTVDAVHVHDLPLAKTALRATNLPVVLDLHENYQAAIHQYRSKTPFSQNLSNPRELLVRFCKPSIRFRWEQKFAMNRAAHVIAVVPEAKSEYERMGIDPGKISVVSNTVDLEWFDSLVPENLPTDHDRFVITYVGTLSGPHRGLDTAIKAMPRVIDHIPSALLRFAGGGSFENQITSFVRDQGIDEHVEFTGWIDENEFPQYIASADVGIVPHRSNPHTNTTVPHKLFQYMAAAKPVVATDTSAVARIIRETNSGIVVLPDNPATFAEAIIELSEGTRLGENGRQAVETVYNWEHDSQILLDLYDEIERTDQ